MERHKVFASDRIKVTEELIKRSQAKSVLEIGAGDYSFSYLDIVPSSDWRMVDFAPPCDVQCDLNSEHVALDLPSKAFDLVICTEVFEHLLWPHKLLAEIRRVLVDGGILIASVPNIVSLSYRLAWLLGRIPSCAASGNLPRSLGGGTVYAKADGGTIGGHVIDFTAGRLKTLLEYSGFSIDVLKGAGIIWHRQVIPHWALPASLSSNLIVSAQKQNDEMRGASYS